MNTYGCSGPSQVRRRRVHQGTRPGPPKNHLGPTGPCQEPPKSLPTPLRPPKSRQEGPRGRQAEAQKTSKKRCTVDEFWLFGRERLWSRLGSSKSRLGGAKRAAQEPPRAPQGGRPRSAKSGLGGRPELRRRPGTGPGAKISPRRPARGPKRSPQRLRRGFQEAPTARQKAPRDRRDKTRVDKTRGDERRQDMRRQDKSQQDNRTGQEKTERR